MLKKTVLSVFALIPLITYGQFSKGDLFLGGNMTGSAQSGVSNNPTTNNTFSIGPRIGYFLNEKWAVVGGLGYSAMFYEYPTFRENSASFSASAGVKRYAPISDKFYFAINGTVSFSRGTDKQTYTISGPNTETPSYSIGFTMGPTFIFFPTSRWGIEAGLGSLGFFHYQNLSTNGHTNSFSAGWSGTLSLGISYYFKK